MQTGLERQPSQEVDTEKQEFWPSRDGFGFVNSFPLGQRLPYMKGRRWGLCGGMAAASLDYKLAGVPIPETNQIPSSGSGLYSYLVERQLDSFGVLGEQIGKFALWTALSDKQVRKMTTREVARVTDSLDRGMPAILGLVYVKFPPTVAIWNNHQVLACGYQRGDDQSLLSLRIYDPNFPKNDQVEIGLRLSGREKSWQWISLGERGWGRIEVRGLFAMPYTFRMPRL